MKSRQQNKGEVTVCHILKFRTVSPPVNKCHDLTLGKQTLNYLHIRWKGKCNLVVFFTGYKFKWCPTDFESSVSHGAT